MIKGSRPSFFFFPLITVSSELSLGGIGNLGSALGLDELSPGSLLALVVCGALDLSPLLESVEKTYTR